MSVISGLIAGRDSQAGTFVSLYTGAGGLDIGFYRAGFTPLWANDIDPAAVATYNQLMDGSGHLALSGDIRRQQLPPAEIADLVIGGPPCQGFSVAGKMDPNDPRSRHVWDFLAIVAQLRPRAFVMENVKALAANRRWSGLLRALRREAWRQGYPNQVVLLNGADYGVPQLRERMFLVGVRDEAAAGATPSDMVLDEVRVLETPQPTTASARPTVREALSALPRVGDPGNDGLCSAKVTPARVPVLRRSPYAGMLFNGQGRPLELDRPALTLPASMGGNRTPIIDQEELEHGTPGWVIGYHSRLRAGRPPVRAVPRRLRRITVEEATALQTFPKGMRFAGTQSAQYRQIGNAVPPELGYHVAVAVRSVLARGPSEVHRPERLDTAQLTVSSA